jgi:hypothetical protein
MSGGSQPQNSRGGYFSPTSIPKCTTAESAEIGSSRARETVQSRCNVSERKPWQPRIREEPLLNPFEPPTDRTRDLGANDRIEVPDEEPESDEDQGEVKDESPK